MRQTETYSVGVSLTHYALRAVVGLSDDAWITRWIRRGLHRSRDNSPKAFDREKEICTSPIEGVRPTFPDEL